MKNTKRAGDEFSAKALGSIPCIERKQNNDNNKHTGRMKGEARWDSSPRAVLLGERGCNPALSGTGAAPVQGVLISPVIRQPNSSRRRAMPACQLCGRILTNLVSSGVCSLLKTTSEASLLAWNTWRHIRECYRGLPGPSCVGQGFQQP